MAGSLNLGRWQNGVNIDFPSPDGLLTPEKMQDLENYVNQLNNEIQSLSPESKLQVRLINGIGHYSFAVDREDVNYMPEGNFIDSEGNFQPYQVTNRAVSGFDVLSTDLNGVFFFRIIQITV